MTARAVATTSLAAKMRLIELREFFSLSARPHRFKPIQAPVSASYFLNAKPSGCRPTTIESARQSAGNFGFQAVQAHFALTMERRLSCALRFSGTPMNASLAQLAQFGGGFRDFAQGGVSEIK